MKTVLIVEDEIVLQDVYKLILTSKGFDVCTANNGQEGLREMAEKKPDIVLLDLFMPVMDGKEFMRTIDLSRFPDSKIVVNTNHSDQSVETEMIELGATKFVLKSSMTPNDLVELVSELTR